MSEERAEAQERARLTALAEVAGIVNSTLQLPEVLNRVMDQILLDHTAYDRVRDRGEVRALPPLSLKGFSTPIEVYELLGLR